MEILETILHSFVNLAMLLFEYIGVGVITFAGLQGLVNYLRRSPDTRLTLAQGLAMGLEFKLGSEILRTVIVRSLSEIAIVGSIIALRAVLTVLIHWEIRNEKADEAAASEQATPAVPTVTTVVTADTESCAGRHRNCLSNNSFIGGFRKKMKSYGQLCNTRYLLTA